MNQLWKFVNLTSHDRTLLLRGFLLLIITRLGLCFLPFQTLRQWLSSSLSMGDHYQPTATINQIVWAVEAASRIQPGGVKCLARALVTQYLLVGYGYPAQLRIGVAKASIGKLDAHAWVEHQGQIVIGDLADLAAFTPLPALEINVSR